MKNKPVVGILLDTRGDPPYISVGKLWKQSINILQEKYSIEVLEIDSYKVENDSRYREFVQKIDLLMVLSPYYTIDRTVKKFPVVAYGLGSMQKGGHWLYDNKDSFKSYDSIILNSTACQSIFEELVMDNSLKSCFIPFGVDTSIFYPRPNKSELRKKYNVPENAFIMLYCGRINLQKNPMLLLSILRDMADKYKNLYLMFMGSFDNFYIPEFSDKPSPDTKNEFYKMVEEFNLNSRIIMFDTQNISQTYAEMICLADIGINLTTLISENFGYTPVEMQACGLPVIGTDWGGLKDTIIDNVTGFSIQTVLSKNGVRINLEQIKNRIELLINDPELLKQMGVNARENVIKNYSYTLFADRIQNLISETYNEFISGSMNESEIKLNPIMKKMSHDIKNNYGTSRCVSWEYLHPEIDFDHYDLIVSKCATGKADDIQWNKEDIVSKGFDWSVINGKFKSYDPRWNQSFELVDWSLSDAELKFLESVDKGHTIDELISTYNRENTFELLNTLTCKGLLMPFKKEMMYVTE